MAPMGSGRPRLLARRLARPYRYAGCGRRRRDAHAASLPHAYAGDDRRHLPRRRALRPGRAAPAQPFPARLAQRRRDLDGSASVRCDLGGLPHGRRDRPHPDLLGLPLARDQRDAAPTLQGGGRALAAHAGQGDGHDDAGLPDVARPRGRHEAPARRRRLVPVGELRPHRRRRRALVAAHVLRAALRAVPGRQDGAHRLQRADAARLRAGASRAGAARPDGAAAGARFRRLLRVALRRQ